MNVFDFDDTIFYGDSTRAFIFRSFRRHPKTLLYIPKIAISALIYYVFHIGTKTLFKERMYSFLKACDGERDVEEFWTENLDKIKPYYLSMHRNDDVIVSASPEFLLKPLEKKLDITVIASKVDIHTGKYDGLNCYHEEKVSRFRKVFPDAQIDSFYSDSYSDEPLALLARHAYIVDGDDISEWDHNTHKKNLRT